MRRLWIVSSLSLLFVCGGPAWAQDEPPAAPAPQDPAPEAPEPDDALDVERPQEVERLKGELARIRAERKRLSGETAESVDISEQIKALKGAELTPVLAPRTEVMGLRLDEAIGMALANNPDYLIPLLTARSAAERVPQELGAFDPVLTWSGTYGRTFSPVPNSGRSRFLSSTAAVGMRMLTGTRLSLSWTESYNKTDSLLSGFTTGSKSYQPSLQLSVTQPLLRNFGIDINKTGILVAQNQALASNATLAETYMNALLAVEQAYWDLVLTEGQLRAQERSLSSSIKFLDDQRKKLEHGAGTQLEVTIAKAGVAGTREAVIVAENSLESARDQIIRLTDPSSDPRKWDRFVVPLDLPKLTGEPELDPATALQQALARRPDYHRALLDLDSARRNLAFAENQVLPQVDFVSSFSEDGFGSTHHGAWKRLGKADFYSWTAGVQVELPLLLRSERARARAARFDLESAETALRSLEASIILDVRRAIRDVRTSKARIDAARASRVLAQERLDATRVQVETGTAVPRDVLDDLAELARAETNEIQAFIGYRLSVTRLRIAEGTALDPWLDRLDPRVRSALDRRAFE